MKHLYGDAAKGQEKIENIYVEFISNKRINNIFFFVFDLMFHIKSVFSEVNWWSKFEHVYGDAVIGQEKIENIFVEFISN